MGAQLRGRPHSVGSRPADTRGKPCRGRSAGLRPRVHAALTHRGAKFPKGHCSHESRSLALAAEACDVAELREHVCAVTQKPVSVVASVAHAVAREACPHCRAGAHSGWRGSLEGTGGARPNFSLCVAFAPLSLCLKTARRVNPRKENEAHQAALLLDPRCVPCTRRAQPGAEIWPPFPSRLHAFLLAFA